MLKPGHWRNKLGMMSCKQQSKHNAINYPVCTYSLMQGLDEKIMFKVLKIIFLCFKSALNSGNS